MKWRHSAEARGTFVNVRFFGGGEGRKKSMFNLRPGRRRQLKGFPTAVFDRDKLRLCATSSSIIYPCSRGLRLE